MELALQRCTSLDITGRIKNLTDKCRISKIEKLLSDCLENLPESKALEYIGELNKNDIMH